MIRLLAAALYPIRRATWCRWFHDWHGNARTVCEACSDWPTPGVAAHQQDRTEEQKP